MAAFRLLVIRPSGLDKSLKREDINDGVRGNERNFCVAGSPSCPGLESLAMPVIPSPANAIQVINISGSYIFQPHIAWCLEVYVIVPSTRQWLSFILYNLDMKRVRASSLLDYQPAILQFFSDRVL